jgi:hypothetical protein
LSRVRAPSPTPLAGVVELVDTLDLGSSASRRESSSLSFRTIFIVICCPSVYYYDFNNYLYLLYPYTTFIDLHFDMFKDRESLNIFEALYLSFRIKSVSSAAW